MIRAATSGKLGDAEVDAGDDDDLKSDAALGIDGTRVSGKAEMSYKRTPIPTAAETASWVAALGAVPGEGPADVSHALDLTVRFCTLAYGRNHAAPARSQVLRPRDRQQHGPEVVEFQFHGSDDFEKGAHCVAYLYRTGAVSMGVGVVLAFKGSTLNTEDWSHNFKWLKRNDSGSLERGEAVFPDLAGDPDADPDMVKAKVHPGFFQYNRTLYGRMRCCSLASIRGLLEDWRAPSTAPHFLAWLHTPGAWQWCAVVGHSLGGAMASIAAADIAARTGGAVLLSTLGSPAAGNKAFVRVLAGHVVPGGGLRAINRGDVVPSLGYSLVAGVNRGSYHSGRRVLLWGRHLDQLDSYHVHLRYTVPSTVTDSQGPPKWVTFKLPGMTYKPSATEDNEEFNLGGQWVQERSQRHEAGAPVAELWHEDLWWLRPGEVEFADSRGSGAAGAAWGGGKAPIKEHTGKQATSRSLSRRREADKKAKKVVGWHNRQPAPIRRQNTGDLDPMYEEAQW